MLDIFQDSIQTLLKSDFKQKETKPRRYTRSKELALQMREERAAKEKAKRTLFYHWNGKCEPDFKVEIPWDGKNEF